MSTSRDNLPAVEDALPIIEERTKKTLTDVRWLLAISLGSIVAVVTVTVSTIAFAQDAGTKAAQAETASLTPRVTAIETEQKNVRSDVHELQLDVRELYRVVRDGRRSERLEQPPTTADGGR